MRNFFLIIVIIFFVGSPVRAEEPTAVSKRLDVLRRAAATHSEVMRYAQEVLKNIPENAKTLTEEQYLAVYAAGLFKDNYALEDLRKIVMVKYQPKPAIPYRHQIRPDFKLKGTVFSDDTFKLDGYPAAKALDEIGWPAAGSICHELNFSKGKMDPKRLEMYANLLCSILSHHTIIFLEEKRSHAPPSAVKLYDKILAMPIVKTVAPWEGGYSEPDDAKPKKKPRSAKKDKQPIKEAQEKLPVERPAEHLVRVWTDSTGKFNIMGRLVELKQGKVQLKNSDGDMISLPLNKLSKADQEYVTKTLPESFPQKPTPKKPAPK